MVVKVAAAAKAAVVAKVTAVVGRARLAAARVVVGTARPTVEAVAREPARRWSKHTAKWTSRIRCPCESRETKHVNLRGTLRGREAKRTG